MNQPMTLDEYETAALRTMSISSTIVTAALGLCGEAGEFADMVKKIEFHGHEPDPEKLVKEIGDVLWYVALAAAKCGYSLNYIAIMNLRKLAERYPYGFSSEASINRAK